MFKQNQSTTNFQPFEQHDERAYLHRTEAAVKIYAQQAVGVFIGTLPILLYFCWYLWDWDMLTVFVISWTIAFGFFVYRLWRWGNIATKEPKQIIQGQDDPEIKKVLVRVQHREVKENGHIQMSNYDLPGDPESLRTWARGMKAGRPFTEEVWAGTNRPFSTPEFRHLRKVGIKKYGLFEYTNPKAPQQGIKPTQKGWDLIEELADNDLDEFVDE